MNNKKLSVTIGVPAYNEEANIKNLLNSLRVQKEEGFYIEKILVISDGSVDGTAKNVGCFNSQKIKLINEKERKGKPFRINQIFSLSESDIVVIIDADIILASENIIAILVEPLVKNHGAQHSFGRALPLLPRTFVQKIAWTGVDIWEKIRKSKYSSDLYLSEGRIRAFKKLMYKNMKFPEASADEAFSFLYCVQKNHPFIFVEKALVYYNLPETFSDYLKQTKRFIKSKGIQQSNYDAEFVKKYYTIGFKAKIIFLFKSLANNPFWTVLYLCTVPLTRILFIMDKNNQETKWDIISSSKKLSYGYGKEKLRIFFSTYDSIGNPHYNGGGANAIYEIAKRLAEKYEVTIICGTYRGAKDGFLNKIYFKHIGISFAGPKLGQLAYHFFLPYFVMSGKFDIWIESFTPPFSTSFLPLFSGKPIVGLVHMLVAEDMRRKYKMPFHLIENLGIKICKYFIVLTEEVEKKIKKINSRSRVEIIPNGANEVLLDNKIAKKHFLYIGRIEIDQKGLDLLLEAYKIISEKIEYPLIIAGGGAAREERKLAEMIEDFKISDKVKFIRRVEKQKKSEVFQGAIAVIISSRFETLPLVVLEALAHGAAVISFDIKGLKWLPDSVSYKIKPFDTGSMADIILKLSKKDESLKIDAEKMKEFIKNYDWETISNKFEKYINSVLKIQE